MGFSNSLLLTSDLVARSYANLVSFSTIENAEDKNINVARMCYMPDPKCAMLAVAMMDESWQAQSEGDDLRMIIKAKNPAFWSGQLCHLYESGLCLPEKGDAGEILAALYALFCGDQLRKEESKSFHVFSVSFLKWFLLLKSGGKVETCQGRSEELSNIEVNFIQVCRNYLRNNGWVRQSALEYMYNAVVAWYAYPMCKAYDIVASIRVKQACGNEVCYHPLLISVKNHINTGKQLLLTK